MEQLFYPVDNDSNLFYPDISRIRLINEPIPTVKNGKEASRLASIRHAICYSKWLKTMNLSSLSNSSLKYRTLLRLNAMYQTFFSKFPDSLS